MHADTTVVLRLAVRRVRFSSSDGAHFLSSHSSHLSFRPLRGGPGFSGADGARGSFSFWGDAVVWFGIEDARMGRDGGERRDGDRWKVAHGRLAWLFRMAQSLPDGAGSGVPLRKLTGGIHSGAARGARTLANKMGGIENMSLDCTIFLRRRRSEDRYGARGERRKKKKMDGRSNGATLRWRYQTKLPVLRGLDGGLAGLCLQGPQNRLERRIRGCSAAARKQMSTTNMKRGQHEARAFFGRLVQARETGHADCKMRKITFQVR